MPANEAELRDCLAKIGWIIRKCNVIVAKGFLSLNNLGEMSLKDVLHVCTTRSKLPAGCSGVHIGYV